MAMTYEQLLTLFNEGKEVPNTQATGYTSTGESGSYAPTGWQTDPNMRVNGGIALLRDPDTGKIVAAPSMGFNGSGGWDPGRAYTQYIGMPDGTVTTQDQSTKGDWATFRPGLMAALGVAGAGALAGGAGAAGAAEGAGAASTGAGVASEEALMGQALSGTAGSTGYAAPAAASAGTAATAADVAGVPGLDVAASAPAAQSPGWMASTAQTLGVSEATLGRILTSGGGALLSALGSGTGGAPGGGGGGGGYQGGIPQFTMTRTVNTPPPGYNPGSGGGFKYFDDKYTPVAAAQGGIMSLPPRYTQGPGDGLSDSIPAAIDGKRPAKIADGEFIVPADVVSHIGNGSSNAGAKRLYSMMDRIRAARTGTAKQGKAIDPNKFLPA